MKYLLLVNESKYNSIYSKNESHNPIWHPIFPNNYFTRIPFINFLHITIKSFRKQNAYLIIDTIIEEDNKKIVIREELVKKLSNN